MKVSSYNKLKQKIDKLNKENSSLRNDIYSLVRSKDFQKSVEVKMKWDMAFDLNEAIWSGTNTNN